MRREAVIAASIMHPNVCTTLDAGTLPDGSPFIVMERLTGVSVEESWLGARVMLIDALDIAIQTAAGLAAAHAAGVLHRDIKPGNVFLTSTTLSERRHVKILDFGVAELSRSLDVGASGLMVGTPHYAAPEQVQSLPNLDQRLDVYGVGVLLYEMLSGKRAFAGASYPELLRNITTGTLEPLAELCPQLPEFIVAPVAKAMFAQRDGRYSSARELLDALVDSHVKLTGEPYVPPWAIVAAPAVVRLGSGGDTVPTAAPIELTLPPRPPPMVGAPSAREHGKAKARPVTATLTINEPLPGATTHRKGSSS